MFHNWNWWYLYLTVCAALYFAYGYNLHYADGCTVRERKHLKDWQEIAAWVLASSGLSAMVISESYHGIFQVARNLLGGRGDDLDEFVAGLFLMAGAVAFIFALLFFVSVLGEAVSIKRANKQALVRRAYCRNHCRSEVCWACKKSRSFACPVGIDRTPVWVMRNEELLAMMKAIETGENDGKPVPCELKTLRDGTCEFLFDMPVYKDYGDKSPRRLTTPPEFKVGGCVIATLSLPGSNRTEKDINTLRAVLRTQGEPLPVSRN